MLANSLSVTAFAAGHSPDISDAAVSTKDTVQFEDHFPVVRAEDDIDNLRQAGLAIWPVVPTLGISMATASSGSSSLARASKAVHTKDALLLLKKSRRRLLLSKLALSGALYFVADSVTGSIIALNGHRPVFYANLPSLAAYAARESKQSFDSIMETKGESLTGPAAAEYQRLKTEFLDKLEEASKGAKSTAKRIETKTSEAAAKQMEQIKRGIAGTQKEASSK